MDFTQLPYECDLSLVKHDTGDQSLGAMQFVLLHRKISGQNWHGLLFFFTSFLHLLLPNLSP